MAKKATPRTKSEIMAALAEAGGITKKQAGTVYETLLSIAYAGAKDPKGIMLPGLGKLIKVKRPARKGRNPATGEAIKIPAKTVVKFRLAKAAKDAVLAK
jgi:DNA-binding protein HU-beta